jgi:protoporphyrinogen oxidase
MKLHKKLDRPVIVIGGGPAGLTAAYELARRGVRSVVLEKYGRVGGLARTECFKGFHFDMGGHRFFTKAHEVMALWEDVLGDDFLRRPRLSRIYYRNKFFYYPLRLWNTLRGLGLIESALILGSYVRWHLFPHRQEETFEQWVTNRFGKRLFQTFFQSYTEKVWGIPCSVLKAEWAAQRIKDLSLKAILKSMWRSPGTSIKTLIEEFHYPRRGPGQLWEAVGKQVEVGGGEVRLNSEVSAVRHNGRLIEGVEVRCDGRSEFIPGAACLSSMPITELVRKLQPPAPREVLQATAGLKYRDFLTVCLIVNRPHLFADNWIYVHDPQVKVGRIQNYKNWSPDMVADPSKTSLGLEYFCNEGDEIWRLPDEDLIELAKRELAQIGLAAAADVEDGCVFRVPKSYPVYDSEYRESLKLLRNHVERFGNLQTMGRNGLHRYNNQDHAMLTAILAVRNLVLGEKHDLWSVNTDQEYHEELRISRSDGPHKACPNGLGTGRPHCSELSRDAAAAPVRAAGEQS